MSLTVRKPEKAPHDAEDRDGGPSSAPVRYKFGPFTIDTAQRALLCDGDPCHLPPRVYALAETLVARAGEAVSKDDLLEAVWPDVLVSEHSLSEAIWQLRRALGDDPKCPEYIQTVPKFGFRFVAPVHCSPSDAGIVAAATDWRLAAASAILVIAAIAGYAAMREPPRPFPFGSATVLRELALPSGEPVRDMDARLSPDATRLLFTDFVSRETLVLDLVNGTTERLSDGVIPLFPYSYRWSPDATSVAVAHHRPIGNSGDVEAIVEIYALGSGETTTFAPGNVTVELIDWSPDGERLLWAESAGSANRLVLASGDGRRVRTAEVDRLQHARLSPDGRALVWVDRSGTKVRWARIGNFVDAETNGDDPEPLSGLLASSKVAATTARLLGSPVFGPDGTRLLYVDWNGRDFDLRSVPLDATGPTDDGVLVQDHIGGHAGLTDWLEADVLLFSRGTNYRDVWVLPVVLETGKDSGPPLLVSTMRGEAGSPTWSEDPGRLLFKSRHERRMGYLYIAALTDAFFSGATPTLTRVPGPEARNPTWRAERIVFDSLYVDETGALDPEGFLAFFETDPEGHAPHPLSTRLRFPSPLVPEFGPFYDKLLFNVTIPSQDALDLAAGLHVLDLHDQNIDAVPGSSPMRASWANDVDLIAQKAGREINAIQVMRSDGTGFRRIAEVPEEHGTVSGWLSISPDGRFVAYPRYFDTDDPNAREYQLWIVNLDTGAEYHVESVDYLNPWRLAWSPDGKLIAFSSMQSGGGVWVMEGLPIELPTR